MEWLNEMTDEDLVIEMNNWNVEGVADLNTITTREEGDNDYDNWRLNAYDAIASNGDAEVKRMMGTLYFDGASSVPGMRFGLEVNINKGLQLSKEAAEEGDWIAQNRLAME
jgi:hypothetical protein